MNSVTNSADGSSPKAGVEDESAVDSVGDWARVSAAVRNSLSQGYGTQHKLQLNVGVMIAVLRTTRAIVRLCLLVDAGLPSGEALKNRVKKHTEYEAVAQQTIVDWHATALTISGS